MKRSRGTDAVRSRVTLLVALLCASPFARAAAPSDTPSPPFNQVSNAGTDCWARLYEHKHQRGRSLTVVGPARLAVLPPRLDFPWEPRYESLAVGPGAMLAIFDDPHFRDGKASFKSGVTVSDLDREMGVFRTIRSLLVACTRTTSTQQR